MAGLVDGEEMSRQLLPITEEQVFKMAKLGCTQSEIAEVFDCDQSTISKRFSSVFANARGLWKLSIRRAQTRRAVKDGSDAMLIHLGKSHLGQIEKVSVTTTQNNRWVDRAHNQRDQKPVEHANGNGHTESNGLAP